MKNKIKMITRIFCIIFIFLLVVAPIKGYCIDDLVTQLESASDINTAGNNITTGLNNVLSLVRFVGSGISIIVVLMLGIKYMVASIEEKAEIKKKAVPIVIGCVILFATTQIVVLINDIVTDVSGAI